MSKFKEKVVSSRPDRELAKKAVLLGDYMLVPYEDARCRLTVSAVQCRDENGAVPIDPESRIFRENFDGVVLIGDEDNYIDQDVELIVQRMCNGEVCEARMTYKDGDGKLVQEITCTIELLETTEEQLISDWSWARLYDAAQHHKERGVELVKQRKITEAFNRFNKSLKRLVAIGPEQVPDETKEELIDFKVILYNNLAFCQLEFEHYTPVLQICNKALSYRPDNAKSLYRRCLAYEGLRQYEEAWKDIQRVLDLNPNNKAVQQKSNQLKEKVIEIKQDYTKVIKKMFE